MEYSLRMNATGIYPLIGVPPVPLPPDTAYENPNPSNSNSSQSKDSSSPDNLSLLNKIQSFLLKNKGAANIVSNGVALSTNLITFLEGNLGFFGADTEKLEKASTFFSKIATATQGILGTADTWSKKNLIPLLGFALEVPIAIFSEGHNLWLGRGLSQGIGQFQGVFDRILVKDENNKPIIKNSEGDYKTLSDQFIEKGFMDSLKTGIKESSKLFKNLITNPKQCVDFAHMTFLCTFLQVGGALLAFAGLDKLGAGVRDLGGGAVDVAFMLDKKDKYRDPVIHAANPDKKKEISYVPAGSIWIGSAVIDFLKRFDFFESRFKHLTQLSLFFDRAAAIFYSIANFATGKSGH